MRQDGMREEGGGSEEGMSMLTQGDVETPVFLGVYCIFIDYGKVRVLRITIYITESI